MRETSVREAGVRGGAAPRMGAASPRGAEWMGGACSGHLDRWATCLVLQTNHRQSFHIEDSILLRHYAKQALYYVTHNK